MRSLLTIIVVLLLNISFGQKVRIVKTNSDFKKVRICEKFDYLHDSWQSDSVQWVCDLSVKFDTLLPETLKAAFVEFAKRANQLGANSFRVDNSDIYVVGDQKFINLKCYWLRQEYRDKNLDKFNSTNIYLFGFLAHHVKIQGYEVEFNGEEYMIQELTYHLFECSEGEDIEIRIGGGRRGDSVELEVELDMHPRYFYFSMTTGSFQNAWISYHQEAFAEYLLRILDEA